MKKTLKYAVGEILLVVVGILIAVSLNNWNENRKTQNRFRTILELVKADFVQDTLVSRQIIDYYEGQDSLTSILVSDSFNLDVLKRNQKICSVPFSNAPFKMTSTSIDLLRAERSDIKIATDTVVQMLLNFYDRYETNFEDIDLKLRDDVATNTAHLKSFDNHSVERFLKTRSDGDFDYFLSRDFKNRVIMHRQLTINLHAASLKNFNASVKSVIPYIDRRLER